MTRTISRWIGQSSTVTVNSLPTNGSAARPVKNARRVSFIITPPRGRFYHSAGKSSLSHWSNNPDTRDSTTVAPESVKYVSSVLLDSVQPFLHRTGFGIQERFSVFLFRHLDFDRLGSLTAGQKNYGASRCDFHSAFSCNFSAKHWHCVFGSYQTVVDMGANAFPHFKQN